MKHSLPESALDSLDSQIVIIDRQGVILYTNRAWHDFSRDNGLPAPHTWVGISYLDACRQGEAYPHPADGAPTNSLHIYTGMCAVMDGSKKTFSSDYSCHSPTEKRWFSMRIYPVQGNAGCFIISHNKVTHRKLTEEKLIEGQAALREAALHTQTILDNMVDGVITIDAQGLMQSFNRAATSMFGFEAEEVLGHNVSMLMPQPHQSRHDSYLKRYLQTGVRHLVDAPREVEGQRRDGTLFPMSLSVSQISRGGQPIFIGLVRDVTQRREYEDEIRRLAFYDPLTQLPNRRLLMDRLKHAIATSNRTGQHGALMFLDLDHFKQLNDSLGHDVGDLLLQQVATRLQSCVREVDSAARLGGDEFVVLLKKADVAMYQAKTAGRNTYRFFDPAMQAIAAAHAMLEKDLRQGLSKNEFVLYYQIQVHIDLQGGTAITGTEALVRWNHPTRGIVPPAEFIALAEETGVILPLGQWVLETACAQLVTWARSPDTANWTMAVNVSASQFAQPDFVDRVTAALKKTGANPLLLKLELTESMLMDNVEDTIVKMTHIKKQGVRLSLDELKIDQSFVRGLLTDPNDAVIARTVVALGHSLGLKVIAEGVETLDQRNLLSSIGCYALQGFYFGHPSQAKELVKYAS